MQDLLDYLNAGLAAKGLSRYKLAKQLGTSETSLSRLWHPNGGMGEEMIGRVAEALALDPVRIMILSGQLYQAGSLRWRYSKLLEEVVNLRAENRALREGLKDGH